MQMSTVKSAYKELIETIKKVPYNRIFYKRIVN